MEHNKKINNQLKFTIIFFGIFLIMFLFLDSAKAVTLEDQLASANSIIIGDLKKYGIMGASIAVGIWSIFKGNVKQAAVAVVIGVILSYYLAWVDGGMLIGAAVN